MAPILCGGGCSPRVRRGPPRGRVWGPSTPRSARRWRRSGTPLVSSPPTPHSMSSTQVTRRSPRPTSSGHRSMDPVATRERHDRGDDRTRRLRTARWDRRVERARGRSVELVRAPHAAKVLAYRPQRTALGLAGGSSDAARGAPTPHAAVRALLPVHRRTPLRGVVRRGRE